MADGLAGKGAAPRPAYAAAGVDVAAGDRAVELMRPALESTRRPEVVAVPGGFGGAIGIPAGYRDPLIVASTDGVGTKTAIAASMGRWDTIGQDLVAMCVDDVVCCGAEPIAFLDYIAVGVLEPEMVAAIVAGVADGCRLAGCALIGGETAEHPGLMEPGTFDLAGTAIGVVERDALLDGAAARPGDVLLGLGASGLHANGYSLVRTALLDTELALDQPYQSELRRALAAAGAERRVEVEPELQLATLGDVLLTPTRIYAQALLRARRRIRTQGYDLHGLAHVTGGGLPGNVPRALAAGLGARVDPARWPMPSVMHLVGAISGLADPELRATFNAGIGMVLALPDVPAAVEAVMASLAADGIPAWRIGEVVAVAADGPRYLEEPLA